MANLRPQQIRGGHSFIGISAALVGVALGIGIVYVDGRADQELAVHAQGSGSCQQQEQACMSKQGATHASCHGVWTQCMQKCMVSGTGIGQCNQDPECQSSCTESSTSQGGKLSCCKGGPQHGNQCKDEVDGKCNPMMPMGGMPPMLPMLPMPMPKPDMPKPPEDPCTKNPTSTECKATQTPSGVSGLLDTFFGTASTTSSTTGSTVQSTIRSVAERLSAFLSGDSADTTVGESGSVQNPTEAVVTPITPSSAHAGQLTPSGAQGGQVTAGSAGQNSGRQTVTGFGSGSQADVNTQTGPILAAIRSVTARIQSLLSSIF